MDHLPPKFLDHLPHFTTRITRAIPCRSPSFLTIEELQEMETALDGKKAKRDEAEELLKTKEGELKEAGEFKKNKVFVCLCFFWICDMWDVF